MLFRTISSYDIKLVSINHIVLQRKFGAHIGCSVYLYLPRIIIFHWGFQNFEIVQSFEYKTGWSFFRETWSELLSKYFTTTIKESVNDTYKQPFRACLLRLKDILFFYKQSSFLLEPTVSSSCRQIPFNARDRFQARLLWKKDKKLALYLTPLSAL